MIDGERSSYIEFSAYISNTSYTYIRILVEIHRSRAAFDIGFISKLLDEFKHIFGTAPKDLRKHVSVRAPRFCMCLLEFIL
jgi:hypothetical protein